MILRQGEERWLQKLGFWYFRQPEVTQSKNGNGQQISHLFSADCELEPGQKIQLFLSKPNPQIICHI